MKEYASDMIRNIAVLSHDGAGKTATVEAMLLACGAVNAVGQGQNNRHILDFDPEEIERNVTIQMSIAPCEWKGHKLNFIDTPGYNEFCGEVKEALRASDAMLIVVSAASGVEVDTERAWDYGVELKMPRMIFINKMDVEKANFFKTLERMRSSFGKGIMPLQIPIGEAENFSGVIDVIQMKAWRWQEGKAIDIDIPESHLEKAKEVKEMAIEAAAEGNDDLLMKYLEGEVLTIDEIRQGLRDGMLSGRVCPVMCGSAISNIGMDKVLDRLIRYLPDASKRTMSAVNIKTGKTEAINYASPFSAFVFKTTIDAFAGKMSYLRIYSGELNEGDKLYNINQNKEDKCGKLFTLIGKKQEPISKAKAGDIVIIPKLTYAQTGDTFATSELPIQYVQMKFPQSLHTVALVPEHAGDEEKLANALYKICEEDLTCHMEKDPEGKQLLVHTMGKVHLEHVLYKVERKYNVKGQVVKPYIPYRETIRQKTIAEGKYKKQSGGHGQYGHVFLEVEPLYNGENFEFASRIVGGVVPKQYIPAVEKGVQETLNEGLIANYPMIHVKVTLTDGSYHTVDSSELAFKMASAIALKNAIPDAKPVILEPIYNVDITVPEEYMGDVIGDINSRRGRVLGINQADKASMIAIKTQVPQAELYDYVSLLRAMTQGRGYFQKSFYDYEEVSQKMMHDIIAERKGEAQ